jgi:hypothetical protein
MPPGVDLLNWLHRGAPFLLAVAAITGTLCIGTLFSVSWLAGRARWMADTPEIARLALALFSRWTVPCFFVSTVSAAGWLEGAHPERVHDPIVLGAAAATLVLVFVHIKVAARARRLAIEEP